MTWPATTAPASSSYDVGVQPWCATAGPTTREASVTRPVTTTSAPAVQGRGDAEAAEVGVGGERARRSRGARTSSPSTWATCGSRPRPAATSRSLVGQAGRVEAAGVGDDPHALLERESEAVLDLADEGPGVAERRVLELVLAEDQHRQLGEVVAGQHVELARPRSISRIAAEPVAVEAGAVADPQASLGRGGRFGLRPSPGWPAKAWAMSSHRSASAPVATRSVSARWTPLGDQPAEVASADR